MARWDANQSTFEKVKQRVVNKIEIVKKKTVYPKSRLDNLKFHLKILRRANLSLKLFNLSLILFNLIFIYLMVAK